MSAAGITPVEMRPAGLWRAFVDNRLAWIGIILGAISIAYHLLIVVALVLGRKH